MQDTAEYRYYRSLLGGDTPRESRRIDWEAAFSALGTDRQFADGGRYGIVRRETSGRGKSLLELGCGAGETAAYMALRKGFEITGVDIFLVPHLQDFEYPGMQFLQFNGNNDFPLPDSRFDVVMAMMVMEHVFEPFDFLREIHRVSKPGATLYLNVPLISAIQHRLTFLFGGLPTTSQPGWFERRNWDGGHLHYFTVSTLRALLAACGFRMHTVSGVGRFAKLKSWWPTMLCKELSVACERLP